MKRSRFSEEQIIGVLKEAEATSVKATPRQTQHQRGDLLRLEAQVWRDEGGRGAAVASLRRRKRTAEARGR